ncbi:unnamed protein product, partial [Rotaria sp. Silwood2]
LYLLYEIIFKMNSVETSSIITHEQLEVSSDDEL